MSETQLLTYCLLVQLHPRSACFLVQSTLLLLNLNVLFTIVVIALANDSTTINITVLLLRKKHSPTDNYYDDKAAVKTRKIQISEPNELNIAHKVANY